MMGTAKVRDLAELEKARSPSRCHSNECNILLDDAVIFRLKGCSQCKPN
jgi:hypothetical protein